VADILENPELLLKEDLTPDQVLEIQKRINPYAGIGGPPPDPDRKRIAAVSYTNLREDYLRRLTMTSLVGFIFQVFSEWEVPVEQRRWVPVRKTEGRSKEETAKMEAAFQPWPLDDLVTRLEATLAIAKEAKLAAEAAAAAKTKAAEADVILPTKASPDQRAAVEAGYREAAVAAARAAGLLYAASHATNRAGAEAGARLRATADAALKYPEAAEVIGRFPLPPPPGQVEMPADKAKEVIGGFLRNWFEFDPSVHVRSGHDAATVEAAVARLRVGGGEVSVDTKDPGHLTLEAVRAAAPPPAAEHRDAVETILKTRAGYNAVVALLRDEDLADAALTALGDDTAFRHYLFPVPAGSPARPAADIVPPQDTFHRWAYYTEVNHEELRTVTEALYPERPDLDWALAVWQVFEGSEAEVGAAFDKHCQRYQDEVPSSIKAVEFGSWSLLADFKENRKKIQFYNKHTEVLKRILDRHTEDKRIGADLMRKRVRSTKARNIAEEGPDAPGLAKYRRALAERGQELGGKGVERVITPEEMRRLEKARGDLKAARELELLDQYERAIAELSALEKTRPLTEDERRDLKLARDNVEKAREMVNVPYEAVRVDVFESNPAAGTFTKSHFHTEADPEPPKHLTKARAAQDAAHGVSAHPAVLGAAAAADAAAGPAPVLAPYAAEHIVRDVTAARTDADRHADAVKAAGGK
jgi:hypothetical protein